jgi:hypothetical protein
VLADRAAAISTFAIGFDHRDRERLQELRSGADAECERQHA